MNYANELEALNERMEELGQLMENGEEDFDTAFSEYEGMAECEGELMFLIQRELEAAI